jgi:hypothetical protein
MLRSGDADEEFFRQSVVQLPFLSLPHSSCVTVVAGAAA